jgi:hypothetical protein
VQSLAGAAPEEGARLTMDGEGMVELGVGHAEAQ